MSVWDTLSWALPHLLTNGFWLSFGSPNPGQIWYDEELAISQKLGLERVDNAGEFCGGSPKKLHNWNHRLSLRGTMLKPIPPGTKHLLALVEDAHRADDEYFPMIHAERALHALSILPDGVTFL